MAWKDGETISPLGLNRIEEAVASMNESYTPTVWEVGDVITAEKLNKIEEGIANASAGQPSWETVFDGSVITAKESEGDPVAVDYFATSSPLDSQEIRVSFNGVEYTCECINDGFGASFDESTETFDWSEYPFCIYNNAYNEGGIYTEAGGTYSVKIENKIYQGNSQFNSAYITFRALVGEVSNKGILIYRSEYFADDNSTSFYVGSDNGNQIIYQFNNVEENVIQVTNVMLSDPIKCYYDISKDFLIGESRAISTGGYTIEGNASIVTIESDGETTYWVKVTGDCTISTVGERQNP